MKQISLIPLEEKSINFHNTENIYVEGDNLVVLNLLQNDYKEKIRVIYIDPPYNTGKDFVYNDKYKNWETMMYPRLEAAKTLLSEDGVIFISIGEEELITLRSICDSIFGKSNFITQFIWEKTQHFGRQKLNAYSNAEYIVCYAKKLFDKNIKELLVENINNDLLDAPLYNGSNNIINLIFPPNSVKFNIPDGTYKKTTSEKYKLMKKVTVLNGTNKNELALSFRSRWSAATVLNEYKKGTRFWVKTESFAIRALYRNTKVAKIAPKQIIFTNPKNANCTYSRFGERVTTSETATKELNNMMGETVFSYPKPLSLICYLLSLIYNYKEEKFAKDFYVLDFFSGSSTTAHACMKLNAVDNGKRKFILVQQPEKINIKSPAYNLGYRTICDIGEKRLILAADEISKYNDKIDCGFKVYECSQFA